MARSCFCVFSLVLNITSHKDIANLPLLSETFGLVTISCSSSCTLGMHNFSHGACAESKRHGFIIISAADSIPAVWRHIMLFLLFFSVLLLNSAVLNPVLSRLMSMYICMSFWENCKKLEQYLISLPGQQHTISAVLRRFVLLFFVIISIPVMVNHSFEKKILW